MWIEYDTMMMLMMMNLHVLYVFVYNLTLNSHTLLCCDCVLLYFSVLWLQVCLCSSCSVH